MKKLLILVLILSCSSLLQEAFAQTSKKAKYTPGLIQYFLQHDLDPLKKKMKLTKIQSASFDQICNHYRRAIIATKGEMHKNNTAKKKAVKNKRQEQDDTIRTILKAHQYKMYTAHMENYRKVIDNNPRMSMKG